MFEQIINRFNAHIDLSSRSIESLVPTINDSVISLCNTLLNQGKVFCWGSESSQLVAQQFCYYMQHSFKHERPALPAIDCSQLSASDLENNLHALAQSNDCVLAFEHPNSQQSLDHLIAYCAETQLPLIICHGMLAHQNYLSSPATCVTIPSQESVAVFEVQWLIMHTLCELIDYQLFNYQD